MALMAVRGRRWPALRQAWWVFVRELAIESATRETLASVAPYVGVLVLLAGLAFGPSPSVLTATGAGLVWVVVLVTAVPLAPTVAIAEVHDDAWDLLRALSSAPTLLAGKLAALWLWLLGAWALATGLVAALLQVPPTEGGAAAGALGTLGVAALTVLLGTLLPAGSRRPALLAVLLLPACLPALVAGTQTASIGTGAGKWLLLLVLFDVLAVTVTWAIYPTLLED